jgi:UDP-N-acetyl-D-glucosamine dehydrogenase
LSLEKAAARAASARKGGASVVVVLGLGFVGTATAANLARCRKKGRALYFVIGLERDDATGAAKARSLEKGRPPAYANDPSLAEVVRHASLDQKNLCASLDPRVIGLADVVVTCINLDLVREPDQTDKLDVPLEGYAAAMHTIGTHAREGALVCVESTLPVGACDRVLYPALCEGVRAAGRDPEKKRPRLAYCYERVMPGPGYLDSVNRFHRTYAGIDDASADAALAFLSQFVDTKRFPLFRHKSTRAAEMGKLLENAYRATNIAFIDEWSRLAEQAGVDLFDVVRSIRVRKGTHDNMMLPGLGVGGYCLTKDALLAVWGAERLLGLDAPMPFSRAAILINERMPLRVLDMARERFGASLAGLRCALIGVTYRPDVADTRSSPSETLAHALMRAGATVVAWDPLVREWPEAPHVKLCKTAKLAVTGADLVVLCLPDRKAADQVLAVLPGGPREGALVVDAWNMIADRAACELDERGIGTRVYGRGDVYACDESD